MKYNEIVAWVNDQRNTLPKNLAEISEFPIAFRKVIVNSVRPDVGASMWCEHLETFIRPGNTFTADQQRLVRDAIVELPAIFAGSREEGQERMRRLEDRMKLLFSRPQAAAMFGMLGPPEPEGGLPLPPDAHPGGAD